MISGALPNVAGLCGDHKAVIMDEAVESIDWDAIPNSNIVGVTAAWCPGTLTSSRARRSQAVCGPTIRVRVAPGSGSRGITDRPRTMPGGALLRTPELSPASCSVRGPVFPRSYDDTTLSPNPVLAPLPSPR